MCRMFWKMWAGGAMLLLLCGVLQASALDLPHCTASIISTQAAQGMTGDAAAAPPERGWTDVQLPDYWHTRWPGYDGVVWYRIQWETPCDRATWQRHPLAVAVDSINMAGQVFVNGDLLWRDRHLAEPRSRSWNMPRSWTLPAATIREGVNTLLIQVHGAAITSPGLGAVHLGDPLTLQARQATAIWHHRTMFTINMMGSLGIAGLFLAMWLFHRKTMLYVWFALLNLSWVAFVYNVTATETWPFSTTADVVRANAVAFMLFCLCFVHFMSRLASRPMGRAATVLTVALTTGMSLLVVCTPDDALGWTSKIAIRSHLLLFALACLAMVWMPLRSKKAGDWVYAGIGIVFGAIALHDWRAMYLQLDVAPLTPYATLLTMIGISLIMGVRNARSMQRIEQFNEELNVAVIMACDELEQSLEKKHELALANTKLQERVALIQDIHDGFGSALVRAITRAEAEQQADTQAHRHISTLKSLRDDLRLVIDSGRSFSEDVPAAPQAWMAQTRYRFSSLFDSIGVRSHWSHPPTWRRTPSAMLCLTLTRFLEEALSNVLKHSQADVVRVVLRDQDDQHLVLEVEDNGIGFDVARASQDEAGVGLHSMHTRIARLGGTMDVSSTAGSTVVRAIVPVGGGEG